MLYSIISKCSVAQERTNTLHLWAITAGIKSTVEHWLEHWTHIIRLWFIAPTPISESPRSQTARVKQTHLWGRSGTGSCNLHPTPNKSGPKRKENGHSDGELWASVSTLLRLKQQYSKWLCVNSVRVRKVSLKCQKFKILLLFEKIWKKVYQTQTHLADDWYQIQDRGSAFSTRKCRLLVFFSLYIFSLYVRLSWLKKVL